MKTWQLINSSLGQNQPSKSPIEINNLAGQITKGDVHVADCLNDHFASSREVVTEKFHFPPPRDTGAQMTTETRRHLIFFRRFYCTTTSCHCRCVCHRKINEMSGNK